MHHQAVHPKAKTLATQVSSVAFAIAVSLPMLLLLCLLLGLVFGSKLARAEDTDSCHGINLISELAPDKLAKAQAEAKATINGNSRLWKVEKPGLAPSYLFGTMHVSDSRVTSLPANAQAAFKASKTVVIETTDILDPAKAQAAILSKPDLAMFTDGKTLSSFLSKDDETLLKAELKRRGIPLPLASHMKPWMLAGMIAMPPCELARRAKGAEILDVKLANKAKAEGKKVLGLETMTEQLKAMADLPIEFHVRGLIETIKLADMMPSIINTMTELYLQGHIALIMPVLMAAGPQENATDMNGYANFEKRIVLMRNHIMAQRAEPILEKGGVFIAVGSLHLPGKEGLVSLLQKDGYTVTAMH